MAFDYINALLKKEVSRIKLIDEYGIDGDFGLGNYGRYYKHRRGAVR